mmetsp:Transcript_33495/g.52723  ORF Transcript_33495/g.52723 Transcript_33495/m.52723 type:complete len:188 (-) Transcript_33495:309-872(-)
MGVTVGGKHLEHTAINGEQCDIEGTTTKIEHEDILLAALLVQTIGDSGSSRLVDDTLDSHTGDGTSIFGGLALGIIEVRRDSNHSILDLLGKEGLSGLSHLLKDHGTDLLGGEGFLLTINGHTNERLVFLVDELEGEELLVGLDGLVLEVATNKALYIENGLLGVDCGLVLCGITNQSLTSIIPGNI